MVPPALSVLVRLGRWALVNVPGVRRLARNRLVVGAAISVLSKGAEAAERVAGWMDNMARDLREVAAAWRMQEAPVVAKRVSGDRMAEADLGKKVY